MTLTVQLFARARELAGSDALSVNLATGATVAELRTAVAAACPALRALLPRCAVAVNEDFADDEVSLFMNAEVALIPPVSGGER
jgi:molybdopterin converting factor subunit 1